MILLILRGTLLLHDGIEGQVTEIKKSWKKEEEEEELSSLCYKKQKKILGLEDEAKHKKKIGKTVYHINTRKK